MTYLLDTHALLWTLIEPDKLSEAAHKVLSQPDSHVVVSAISFWEISLKYRLGKLKLTNLHPEEIPDLCQLIDLELLPLDPVSCASYVNLPQPPHRDPFDNMLVWLALQYNYTLISGDKSLEIYTNHGLRILW
jgi:PIN domain nuclease of toxin-antitoxin system